MFAFINSSGFAVEVFPGVPFVDRDDIQRPSNWLENAAPMELAGAGIVDIVEPPSAPSGKVVIVGPLTVVEGKPVRSYAIADSPPPGPQEAPPDGPTNSDWRVGLILWGRFAEVEAKVIEARDAKSVAGAIAWQRWEYANNVYRAELMRLRDTFGFSAEDVEESLRRAAEVAQAARAA